MSKKATFDPILFEKLFRKSQEYAKASKKNSSIAKKWFLIAKNDIEITQLLHTKQFYAGSTYHLQQAFEKLVKGYHILSGREDPSKTFGHNYNVNKLKKDIKDEYINTFLELSKSINNTTVDLDSAEKTLSFLEKSEDQIRLIKSTEFNKILDLINKLETILTSVETIEKTEAKLQEKKFFNMLKQLILHITRIRVRDSQIQDAIKQEQVINYLNGAVINMKLQLITLFTFLHFNTPRYPSDKKTEVNFFNYSVDLGIVEVTPTLIKIFNEIYDSFEIKNIDN